LPAVFCDACVAGYRFFVDTQTWRVHKFTLPQKSGVQRFAARMIFDNGTRNGKKITLKRERKIQLSRLKKIFGIARSHLRTIPINILKWYSMVLLPTLFSEKP